MNNDNLPVEPHLQTLTIGPKVIIAGNPLVRVPQPREQYYRCVGYLLSHVTGNGRLRGTGTLIAAGEGYGILTCAHTLYDPGVAGLVERIEFMPAKTGNVNPYGVITADSDMVRIAPGYRGPQDERTPVDYGVVKLFPDQIPAGIGPLPEMRTVPPIELASVQVTGYPAVEPPLPNDVMYYSRGSVPEDPTTTGLLKYAASTMGGSSGSPVCAMRVDREAVDVPDLRAITAVHVGGNAGMQINWGVYLTPDIIHWVVAQLND